MRLNESFPRAGTWARVRIGTRPAPLLLAGLLGSLGCTSIPEGRSAVDDLSLRGASGVDAADAEERLATASTPKFLGLFRGVVFDYELFDRYVLQRDLARVERYYRSRGYYEAHARAARVRHTAKNHVRVEVVVEEGTPTRVRQVTFPGADGLPKGVERAVKRAARVALPMDAPFDEEAFIRAEAEIKRALTDRGYAFATVERDATVDIIDHSAHVTFTLVPGRRARFGAVTVEGLGELPEDRVRRTLDIERGERYSTADLDTAQQALLDLQVFSSVEIIPDLAHASATDPEPEVALHVKLQPAKLRAIKLGGGVEFDATKTDVHGLIGWENHNFFGGLRTFSVQFRPGLVFYPLRVDNLVAPTNLLPMEKLRAELRQPGFIEARTNGFVRPEFNVIPFLPPKLPSEASVIGYAEPKFSVGVDRQTWRLYSALAYNFQVEYPFAYVGARDPALRTLIISNPQLLTNFDLRDDRVRPHKGIYVGNDFQVAGGPFGGNASDIKVQPEVRGYVPIGKKVTFAVRGSIGLLFPFNYGDIVQNQLGEPLTDANRADRTQEFQIMYFRGFYAGGPSSNRGYPLRGIGPHAFVPFLNPDLGAIQVANNCNPQSVDRVEDLDPSCAITVGGFSLWEASAELRFPIGGPISGAAFCDAADVSPKRFHMRWNRPHLSCGLGARYDTPVGPIRLDVGYRIPGLQVLETLTPQQQLEEGNPGNIFGLPLGIAFGIGESF